MKKLLPAISLLLISAVLLSTASYAWFSMNTTVTATGMQVTANAPTSLLISTTNATTDFGSTVALENDTEDAATMFSPVAYAGIAASWYQLTAKGMADIDENGRANNFTEVSDGAETSAFISEKIGTDAVYTGANTMVYHDQIWLKVEGENSQTVTATAAYVSNPTVTDKIKDAMHVVFVINGAVVDTINMGGTDQKLTTKTLTTLTANAENGTLVDIYYFLSGNDTDCMNKNIAQDDTMSIDLTFTAANA